jgi:hypothetical protein
MCGQPYREGHLANVFVNTLDSHLLILRDKLATLTCCGEPG